MVYSSSLHHHLLKLPHSLATKNQKSFIRDIQEILTELEHNKEPVRNKQLCRSLSRFQL